MVALVSSLVAEEFKNKTGIETISLPAYACLDTPVSTHADMLLSVIDNNIFIYKDYYLENEHLFSPLQTKYNIIKVEKECKSKYPFDVALNVLIIDKKILIN